MTATVAVDALPTASQLWALAYFLKANWATSISTRSSFETSIKGANSTAEQRRGLRICPFRTITCELPSAGAKESQQLQMMLLRMGQSRFLFPLFSDVAEIPTALTAGQTILNFDARFRRLSVGRRVVVYQQSPTTLFEVGVISTISNSSLTLTSGLVNNFNATSRIAPLLECDLAFNNSGTIITDQYLSTVITAVEATNGNQLSGLCVPGDFPASTYRVDVAGERRITTTGAFRILAPDLLVPFPTYSNLPILDVPPDFAGNISLSVIRAGSSTKSGIENIPAVYGDRAALRFDATYSNFSRSEMWRLLSFFESRGGRLFPFWTLSPLTQFEPVSVGGGGVSITVKAQIESFDWMFLPYIGIRQVDGTCSVRRCVTVTRAAGNDTILFDAAITGLTLGSISQVQQAILARFDSDELEESWMTTEVATCSLTLKELILEKDLEITDLNKIITTDLLSTFRPALCAGGYWFTLFEATFNCGTATWGAVTTSRHECATDLDHPDTAWVYESGTSSVKYHKWVKGGKCGDAAYAAPATPSDPGITPDECGGGGGGGGGDGTCQWDFIVWEQITHAAPSQIREGGGMSSGDETSGGIFANGDGLDRTGPVDDCFYSISGNRTATGSAVVSILDPTQWIRVRVDNTDVVKSLVVNGNTLGPGDTIFLPSSIPGDTTYTISVTCGA